MEPPNKDLFEVAGSEADTAAADTAAADESDEGQESQFNSEDVMGVAFSLREKFWMFLRGLPDSVLHSTTKFISLAMKIDDFAEKAHRIAEEYPFEPPTELMDNKMAMLEGFIARANELFVEYSQSGRGRPVFAENARAWRDRLIREEAENEKDSDRVNALVIDVITQVVSLEGVMPLASRKEAQVLLDDVERIRAIMTQLDELASLLSGGNPLNSYVVELMEIVSEFGDSYGVRDLKEILRLIGFSKQDFLELGRVLDEPGADEVSNDELYYFFEELFTDFQALLETFLAQHIRRLRELWHVKVPTGLSN